MEDAVEEEKEGWSPIRSPVLSRGWRVGKKVAIAGVAITSAPVVIPPLLLFSTLGLAFAFPFGVYFAGFAFTDKVMRSLLSPPLLHHEEEEEVEALDEEGIEVVGEKKADEKMGIGKGREAEEEEGEIEIVAEEKGIGGMVEESEPMKEVGSEEKKEVGDRGEEGDGSVVVPSECEIEICPPGTEDSSIGGMGATVLRSAPRALPYVAVSSSGRDIEIKPSSEYASTVEDKWDRSRGIELSEEEKPMKLESEAGEKKKKEVKTIERMREEGEEEGKEEKVVDAATSEGEELPPIAYPSVAAARREEHETGFELATLSSEYEMTEKDNWNRGSIGIIEQEQPMEETRTEEKKKAEEVEKIQGMDAAAVPESKQSLNNSYPFADVVPAECDNENLSASLSSKYASAVEKGNGEVVVVVNEVKPPEVMGEEGIEDERWDAAAASAAEAKELPPSGYHSLAMVLEEREIEIEMPSLSSENASFVANDWDREGSETVEEEKPTVETGMGEKEEADEGQVEMQEAMEPPRRGSLLAALVSVESKSVIEPSAVEKNECGTEMLMSTEEARRVEERVTEDEGKEEYGGSVTAPKTDEPPMVVYHSFVSVAPVERDNEMEPSSLSSEYASAVEDHSSDMTDAESGPAPVVVETAAVVHSDDEGFHNEEMIWEQIYAMRTIVGYKAPLHSSLVEELRALYLFTGVEPPLSLKDTADLMEVGDKLQFLKSVIGVK